MDDRLIFWRKDLPRYFVGAAVTEDGRYLIVSLSNGTDPKNRLYYADLGDPMNPKVGAPVTAIVDEDIAELSVLGKTYLMISSLPPSTSSKRNTPARPS